MAQENDIVLIHYEDQPVTFARIEEILPDSKPDWYHVKLLMLQIPLQTVTWILRDRYIDGDEFTMNGHSMKLERITAPEPDEENEDINSDGKKAPDKKENVSTDEANVISLFGKKK